MEVKCAVVKCSEMNRVKVKVVLKCAGMNRVKANCAVVKCAEVNRVKCVEVKVGELVG